MGVRAYGLKPHLTAPRLTVKSVTALEMDHGPPPPFIDCGPSGPLFEGVSTGADERAESTSFTRTRFGNFQERTPEAYVSMASWRAFEIPRRYRNEIIRQRRSALAAAYDTRCHPRSSRAVRLWRRRQPFRDDSKTSLRREPHQLFERVVSYRRLGDGPRCRFARRAHRLGAHLDSDVDQHCGTSALVEEHVDSCLVDPGSTAHSGRRI